METDHFSITQNIEHGRNTKIDLKRYAHYTSMCLQTWTAIGTYTKAV